MMKIVSILDKKRKNAILKKTIEVFQMIDFSESSKKETDKMRTSIGKLESKQSCVYFCTP